MKKKLIFILLLSLILIVGCTSFEKDVIVYEGSSIILNEGIGNEWEFEVEINNKKVNSGDVVKPLNGEYYVRVKATEVDKYSDRGSRNSTYDMEDLGKKKCEVIVRENRGPGAGKKAIVVSEFNVK